MIIVERREADVEALARLAVDLSALVDDGADYRGKLIEKPWGHEHELRATKEFSAWQLRIKPFHGTSLHCHVGKTTMLSVESGIVSIQGLGGCHIVRAGESALIERGTFHSTGCAGGQEAVVVEVEWPPNRRDLVRLQDRYGRVGKPYAGG